MPKEIEHAKSL